MGGVNLKEWSTSQLLESADRSDPWVRILCERFESQLDAVKKERSRMNEFRRELTALMGML